MVDRRRVESLGQRLQGLLQSEGLAGGLVKLSGQLIEIYLSAGALVESRREGGSRLDDSENISFSVLVRWEATSRA